MPPSSNLAPGSAQAPTSPLRSISLGPQPTLSNSSSSSAQSYNTNSGAATPPRKAVALGNSTSGSGSGSASASASASGSSTPALVPGGAPGKTRARDLLRKHYGLGVGPPPVRAQSNPSDPMDLNSAAFDAKSYYEQLITTSTLPTLLKKENELMSEIRQLDSERQSLVYNHHHELIAASDTIGAPMQKVLDADLDLLKAAFSEISRLSSEVSLESQRPRRSTFEETA
ncbi:Vps51/Vps67-domain-containing protein [Ephemerocybe angulata]|uniref:Vacuolar protein sorting-associated protein 51 homolog n=1 Tax=Ephemerocybe angulata TaxID=980116 RepID=A0A8H6M3R4_9AGAR|nr:Vps51/Vps67-domain-containing protein [Tulosesus angulatus]